MLEFHREQAGQRACEITLPTCAGPRFFCAGQRRSQCREFRVVEATQSYASVPASPPSTMAIGKWWKSFSSGAVTNSFHWLCHNVYRASPKKDTGWPNFGLEFDIEYILACSWQNVNGWFINIVVFPDTHPKPVLDSQLVLAANRLPTERTAPEEFSCMRADARWHAGLLLQFRIAARRRSVELGAPAGSIATCSHRITDRG